MVKNLRNLYYEKELDSLIEVATKQMQLPSKSAFVREVLKEKFHCCEFEGCYSKAIVGNYCQLHSKKHKGRNCNGSI